MIDLLRSLPRLAAAAIAVVAALSHAQSAPLNDTGQTSCYDASDVAVACDAATAGNTGTRPHQDGRYGRDAAAAAGALSKVGGGAAGFDFSCVLWNGTVINGPNCHVGLLANTSGTPSATPSTDWACTKDNVTGRVWSLQSQGPMTWTTANSSNLGDNSNARCGAITAGNAWRLPTTRELLSIVHNGRLAAPVIDAGHFPSTVADYYWTSEAVNGEVWTVDFHWGFIGSAAITSTSYVRLVRRAL